jgi:hypothetical protein
MVAKGPAPSLSVVHISTPIHKAKFSRQARTR